MIKKILCMGLFVVSVSPELLTANCNEMTTYQIITGSKKGTYYQIGKNLAKYVAPEACIKLEVLNSNGSLDNAFKLVSPNYPRLKFAIVQNDVLQELKKRAEKGNKSAKKLFSRLRVIKPLYNEEIHIIANAGSEIHRFGDLKGRRIAIGKEKSGTAMTSLLLYKEMFGQPLQTSNRVTGSFDESLKKLRNNELDAVVSVAGQPVERLKQIPKEGKNLIRLLSYNERNDQHNPVQSYYTADIHSSSYPWIDEDIPTLTTKAFLVTFKYTNPATVARVEKFARSLEKKLPEMQKMATSSLNTPHPKWKQVSTECNQPLPQGWKYFVSINKFCSNSAENSSRTNSCTEEDKILGFCTE